MDFQRPPKQFLGKHQVAPEAVTTRTDTGFCINLILKCLALVTLYSKILTKYTRMTIPSLLLTHCPEQPCLRLPKKSRVKAKVVFNIKLQSTIGKICWQDYKEQLRHNKGKQVTTKPNKI